MRYIVLVVVILFKMEESDLREFARALAPRMIKSWSDFKSPQEKVSFLLKQPETEKLKELMVATDNGEHRKSVDIARLLCYA